MTSTAEVRGSLGHEGLLTYPDGRHLRSLDAWAGSAMARSDKIVALAPPDDPGQLPRGIPTVAIVPDGRDPAAQLRDQLRRAVDEGFGGMGVVVWADNVVRATSVGFHTVVESALEDICSENGVSVLCLYDRRHAGLLGMAVDQHADGLHDVTLTVRRRARTLLLAGEIDMDNLAVLDAALGTTGPDHLHLTRLDLTRLDLTDVEFLSAAAGHRIGRFAAGGGRVHGARPPVERVLRLGGPTG